MVKKLRYLARFIVVCLLLKKTKEVKELIRELSKQIDEYVKIYDPEDQLEWQMVRNEINDFIDADNTLLVENSNLTITNRLNVHKLPNLVERTNNSTVNLRLSEIVIIGNCQNQIKFSELSIDMFRMLQTVEREPLLPSNNEKSPGTNLYVRILINFKQKKKKIEFKTFFIFNRFMIVTKLTRLVTTRLYNVRIHANIFYINQASVNH